MDSSSFYLFFSVLCFFEVFICETKYYRNWKNKKKRDKNEIILYVVVKMSSKFHCIMWTWSFLFSLFVYRKIKQKFDARCMNVWYQCSGLFFQYIDLYQLPIHLLRKNVFYYNQVKITRNCERIWFVQRCFIFQFWFFGYGFHNILKIYSSRRRLYWEGAYPFYEL